MSGSTSIASGVRPSQYDEICRIAGPDNAAVREQQVLAEPPRAAADLRVD